MEIHHSTAERCQASSLVVRFDRYTCCQASVQIGHSDVAVGAANGVPTGPQGLGSRGTVKRRPAGLVPGFVPVGPGSARPVEQTTSQLDLCEQELGAVTGVTVEAEQRSDATVRVDRGVPKGSPTGNFLRPRRQCCTGLSRSTSPDAPAPPISDAISSAVGGRCDGSVLWSWVHSGTSAKTAAQAKALPQAHERWDPSISHIASGTNSNRSVTTTSTTRTATPRIVQAGRARVVQPAEDVAQADQRLPQQRPGSRTRASGSGAEIL